MWCVGLPRDPQNTILKFPKQFYQYKDVLLSVLKFQKCFTNFHSTTCWNILQFSDKSVYFQIVKTKLEQIFRKTFWNITKGSNNNGDDNKLIVTIHYLHVSDKWCVVVQLFINLSRNIYVCGTAYHNDCAYFFLLIPYNDTVENVNQSTLLKPHTLKN